MFLIIFISYIGTQKESANDGAGSSTYYIGKL